MSSRSAPASSLARAYRFTPSHRGGSGSPLVCLHGFCETWRTWELVLPRLERLHDVLAPTLPGHAGGPPLAGERELGDGPLADAVEQAMDAAGFRTAHLVGNSLGGYVALRLAERGRANSVVAFAPAGGWAEGDDSYKELLAYQRSLQELLRASAPYADAILSTREGRRQATRLVSENFEHIPVELLAHQLQAAARCEAAVPLLDHATRFGWRVRAERIACPVRIVWGTEDKLLRWPSTAALYRTEWLPHADWVVLDGAGHCPQLDVPREAAELIVGFTAAPESGVAWDPVRYPTEIRDEIPRYDELQRRVVEATADVRAERILELGTGAGETARSLLASHPGATLIGLDSSPEMLAAAREALPADRIELRVARLEDALPAGPFDLVASVLAIHHLSSEEKADLSRRVAEALRPGGRFVLGDVVVPERPEEAVIPLEEGFDRPDTVDTQLGWLRKAGLEAKIVWAEQDLAVLLGERVRRLLRGRR